MNVTAIIPARYASTRFPGKPLVDILGKPMIQRVYERVRQAQGIDRVLVATDDPRIHDAVRAFGGEVAMTRADHPTGTDRLAEVAALLDTDLVVNVQGDEPLIDPRMIEEALAPMRTDASIPMGTLKTPIATVEEFLNPNVVKVVTDREGYALYFSRAPIPHPRDLAADLPQAMAQNAPFKHVGLYVYRRDFLLRYPHLPVTPLEDLEKLEQLRALEHGFRIRVVATELNSLGVDTPEDLERVRHALARS
ncbi:3-deoxy-manno-octulosonate cytidylyltransferase [Geoalkalibacter halelectricus]|uniref:3-deoxy-manno-octulosonate cytidylyltransferase n=1 Tax=Geoalkalibacter halelectricus TaxID=2847045 RepID=A0ABY5ZHX9_9BACT|nr:3-deoxy-manno-octulosonate cytidylyltransferase [Geoalkalibacter halelectricus]MDO3379370.1 3-deoxy-manno-octulosonate cytidylyltransferase [Geoalkalibacter halelectricus]UWZ78752.1 3-deoxy-manno-octulosonate cytidylyltransferase [Geoalkalibacter halelectricus]